MVTAAEYKAAMLAEGIQVDPDQGRFSTSVRALQQVSLWWRELDSYTREVLDELFRRMPAQVASQLRTIASDIDPRLLPPGGGHDFGRVIEAAQRALDGTGAPPEFNPSGAVVADPAEPAAQQAFTVRWEVINSGGPSEAYKDHLIITDLNGRKVQEKDVDQGALDAGGTRQSEATVDGLAAGTYVAVAHVNWSGTEYPDQPRPPAVPPKGYQVPVGSAPIVVGGLRQGPNPGYQEFAERIGQAVTALFATTEAGDMAGLPAELTHVAEALRATARIVPDDWATPLHADAEALADLTVANASLPQVNALLKSVNALSDEFSTASAAVELAQSRAAVRGVAEDYDRTNPPPSLLTAARALGDAAVSLLALRGTPEVEAPEAEAEETRPPTPPADAPPVAPAAEEPAAAAPPSEEVKRWAEDAATMLVARLVALDSDDYYRANIEWFRDDLVSELLSRASDSAGAQEFEREVQTKITDVATHLQSEARRRLFAQLLTRTGQGAVWLWVKDFQGLRDSDVSYTEDVMAGREKSAADYAAGPVSQTAPLPDNEDEDDEDEDDESDDEQVGYMPPPAATRRVERDGLVYVYNVDPDTGEPEENDEGQVELRSEEGEGRLYVTTVDLNPAD